MPEPTSIAPAPVHRTLEAWVPDRMFAKPPAPAHPDTEQPDAWTLDERILDIVWEAFCDDLSGNPTYLRIDQCAGHFEEWLRSWRPQRNTDLAAVRESVRRVGLAPDASNHGPAEAG